MRCFVNNPWEDVNMNDQQKKCPRWTIALAMVLLMTGMGMTVAQEVTAMSEAEALSQQGEWDGAQAAFAAIVAAEPDNGRALFMLGYSHYNLRQWDQALEAWERAVALDYRKADTLYSMACVLSLAGRVDEAVATFSESLDSGFDDDHLIVEDRDLDNIRDHPKFKKIFTPPPPFEPHPDATRIEMETPSGIKVFAELYLADAATPVTPVILLLHQAGSNSAEYLPIAPRLAAAGFHAMAIDARGGGRRFGRDNHTVTALGERGQYSDAVEDTLTAVGWLRARGYGGHLVVWGSSYSASNVIRLLVEAPAVFAAGLAFSPGNPLDASGQAFGPRVAKPILLTWPEYEWGADSEATFAAVGSNDKVLIKQEGGRHGSSTLFADLNPQAEKVWAEVLAFLDDRF
jgi:dienelactone hydrolase